MIKSDYQNKLLIEEQLKICEKNLGEKATTILKYEQEIVLLKNQVKIKEQKAQEFSRKFKLLENDNSVKELSRKEEVTKILVEKEFLHGAMEEKISELKELRDLLESSNDKMNNLEQQLKNLKIDRNEKIGLLKKQNNKSISEIEKLRSVIDEYSTRNNDLNEIVDKQRRKETVLIESIENKKNELENIRKKSHVLKENYEVNFSYQNNSSNQTTKKIMSDNNFFRTFN